MLITVEGVTVVLNTGGFLSLYACSVSEGSRWLTVAIVIPGDPTVTLMVVDGTLVSSDVLPMFCRGFPGGYKIGS